MAKRSIVYVDGFNLYYGTLRGTPYKWLDLEAYFTRLRQDDEIQHIRYFTARVAGAARQRQDAYLRALATLPSVDVVLGRFKTRRVRCQVAACVHAGDRMFSAPEEKRTDVNIAVTMLDDAYQDLCERFVIVSGDSDLVPAVDQVKARFPEKEVIVYVPARTAIRGAATELRGAADKDRTLPLELLRHCQLPASVADGAGATIQKPAGW